MPSPRSPGVHSSPDPLAGQDGGQSTAMGSAVVPASSDAMEKLTSQRVEETQYSILAADSPAKCPDYTHTPTMEQLRDTQDSVISNMTIEIEDHLQRSSEELAEKPKPKLISKPITSPEYESDNIGFSFLAQPTFAQGHFSGPQHKPHIAISDQVEPTTDVAAALQRQLISSIAIGTHHPTGSVVSPGRDAELPMTQHPAEVVRASKRTRVAFGSPQAQILAVSEAVSLQQPTNMSVGASQPPFTEKDDPKATRPGSDTTSRDSSHRNTGVALDISTAEPYSQVTGRIGPEVGRSRVDADVASSPCHDHHAEDDEGTEGHSHRISLSNQLSIKQEPSSVSRPLPTTSNPEVLFPQSRNPGVKVKRQNASQDQTIRNAHRETYRSGETLPLFSGLQAFPGNQQVLVPRPAAFWGDSVVPSSRVSTKREGTSQSSRSKQNVTRPGGSANPPSPSVSSAISNTSNISRRRGIAITKHKRQSESRAEIQKTFNSWTERLALSEKEVERLDVKLHQQAKQMADQNGMIEQQKTDLSAMRERIEVGKRQLRQCCNERDSFARDNDQLDAQNGELQQQVKQRQAENSALLDQKSSADDEVKRLTAEISEQRTKHEKLGSRMAEYKRRFNKALEEQQRFYQHQKAFVDRVITDTEELKRRGHEDNLRAITKGELVRDDLHKALEASRAFAKGQNDQVCTALNEINSKLRDTERQLEQEVERSNALMKQLDDNTRQGEMLQEICSRTEGIMSQVAQGNTNTHTDNPKLVLEKLETIHASIRTPGQEVRCREDLADLLRAVLDSSMERFGKELHKTGAHQTALQNSVDSIQESIRGQLAALLEGHTAREADLRQELLEIAEEKSQCATLLDVRYRQLKDLELSHERQTEEVQALRLKNATLESIPQQDPGIVAEITELQNAGADKDIQIRELERQAEDRDDAHGKELALLRGQLENEASKFRSEFSLKEANICDLEKQVQDRDEAHQKEIEDIKQRLREVYENFQQQKQKALRSVPKKVTDATAQTEPRETKGSELGAIPEDTAASHDVLRKEVSEASKELAALKSDATAETVALRRHLDDANQRIANLTHRLRSPGQSAADDDALGRLAQTSNELLAAKKYLNKLEERALDVDEMNRQFQTMLEIQQVLHHTHQHCIAETEAAEKRLANFHGDISMQTEQGPGGDASSHMWSQVDCLNSSQQSSASEASPSEVVVQVREKRIVLRTPSQCESEEEFPKLTKDEERTQRRVAEPKKSILRRTPNTENKIIEPVLTGPFRFMPSFGKAGLPAGLRTYSRPVIGHARRSSGHGVGGMTTVRSILNNPLGDLAPFQRGSLPSPIEWQDIEIPGQGSHAPGRKRLANSVFPSETKKPRVENNIDEDVTEKEEVSRHFPRTPDDCALSQAAEKAPVEQQASGRRVKRTYSKLTPIREMPTGPSVLRPIEAVVE